MAGTLAVVLVSLLIFAVCREIVTWYFKYSAMLQRLESIDRNLERIVDHAIPPPAPKI